MYKTDSSREVLHDIARILEENIVDLNLSSKKK
jgi:hypothetical protein